MLNIDITARFVFVAAATVAIAGCSGDEPKRERTSAQHCPIVGGAPENGFEAVGALMQDGEAYCTGTLVDPTTVVTAAHCNPDGSAAGIQFAFGADVRDGGNGINLVNVTNHPQYDDVDIVNDIAVLKLEHAVDVTPIPVMNQTMGQDWIGRDVTFVGYGITGPNDEVTGVKRSVVIPLTEVAETTFTYASPGKNTCQGDSGGPALALVDGGFRLIGVTSYGDQDCAEYGVNTRVDAYLDFIDADMSQPAPPPAGGECAEPGQDTPNDDWPSDEPPADEPGNDSADICEEQGWYGDGICDVDCPKPDPDCA